MIEQTRIHVPFELLDEELDRLGREGWVPWDKEVSQIPSDRKNSITVRFWRVKQMAFVLLLSLFLAGCMPAFQVNQVPMDVQGKQVVYVAASWHNGQGVNACAIDRYIDGNLVAHDILTNSGLAEMILPTIVNAIAPVATSVGPYIK